MFITKKHISRRTVLRGLGAAVSLPFLEAMTPARTALGQTAASPKSRFAGIEIVHGSSGSTEWGTNEGLLIPKKEGRDFDFGMIIEPLEPLRDYITNVSMTDCAAADPWTAEEVGADHFRSAAVFLTAAHPKQTVGSDVYCGTSLDQLYAEQYGQDTPVPSIQLTTENADAFGNCGWMYSCWYMNTISWSSPTTPLPMTLNPRLAFEQLFGTGSSPEDRAARRRLNRSILDGIVEKLAELRGDLDGPDQVRFDSYLENVREIERRIQAIEEYNTANPDRDLPSAPVGVPESWDEHTKLQMDLIALGFASETTRVATLKLGRDTSNRVFPESGVATPFHSASHHQDVPTSIMEFAQINRYHTSLIAYFLHKLQETSDGDGNLLDHSLIFFGSGMGNSNVHGHKRVPAIIAGHANGNIAGNNHVRCAEDTPQANILLSMAHKLGLNLDIIGDSTDTIAI